MKMTLRCVLDQDACINWNFITHEEREQLLDHADEVILTDFRFLSSIPCSLTDSLCDFDFTAYIAEVEAYIDIRFTGCHKEQFFT